MSEYTRINPAEDHPATPLSSTVRDLPRKSVANSLPSSSPSPADAAFPTRRCATMALNSEEGTVKIENSGAIAGFFVPHFASFWYCPDCSNSTSGSLPSVGFACNSVWKASMDLRCGWNGFGLVPKMSIGFLNKKLAVPVTSRLSNCTSPNAVFSSVENVKMLLPATITGTLSTV
ncbi:hypothetical protein D1872_213810 [compost metagenome]